MSRNRARQPTVQRGPNHRNQKRISIANILRNNLDLTEGVTRIVGRGTLTAKIKVDRSILKAVRPKSSARTGRDTKENTMNGAKISAYSIAVRQLCAVGCAIMLSACATLQISTEPTGAELVAQPSAGSPIPLGKSPASLTSDKLSEILKQGPVLIRATLEGHESANLLVPTTLRGELKASLLLKKLPEMPAKDDEKEDNENEEDDKEQDAPKQNPAELNGLVRDILDAERGIIEKRFDDAQRISIKIREKFPSLAVSYFLEGSIQFQKGELQAAIASLNRGLELDPDDTVTRNFIEQIKKNSTPK